MPAEVSGAAVEPEVVPELELEPEPEPEVAPEPVPARATTLEPTEAFVEVW